MYCWNTRQVKGFRVKPPADNFPFLKGQHLCSLFDDWTRQWHDNDVPAISEMRDFQDYVKWIHYNNFMLWHQEDEARREDVADSVIVQCKRAIDRINQQRNDGIESIDLWIADQLKNVPQRKEAAMNSETCGSIIDRLSILSLKIYHMREQTERSDVPAGHLERAQQRLSILREQRQDLLMAFDDLWYDLEHGRKRHKIYRQYKMYNDPDTNPALYSRKGK